MFLRASLWGTRKITLCYSFSHVVRRILQRVQEVFKGFRETSWTLLSDRIVFRVIFFFVLNFFCALFFWGFPVFGFESTLASASFQKFLFPFPRFNYKNSLIFKEENFKRFTAFWVFNLLTAGMTPYGVIPWSAHIYYYWRNIYMENFEKVTLF